MKMFDVIYSRLLVHLYIAHTVAYLPKEMDCPLYVDHHIFYSGLNLATAVPHRALQTVPREFHITTSNIPSAGLGVVAKTFVKRYTWLGEYEGEFKPRNGSSTCFSYAWQISRDGTLANFVDAGDVRMSNWLRYINCARYDTEENVMSVQCLGRVYYLTKKDIAPEQELLVFYGAMYMRSLGINFREYYRSGDV